MLTKIAGAVNYFFLRTTPHSSGYSANGTFTVPTGVTQIFVYACGGGGGGGGGSSTTGGSGSGGGGGWGAIPFTLMASVTPGAVLNVTIGAAGTSGAANTVGGVGGDTILSSVGTWKGAPGGDAPNASSVITTGTIAPSGVFARGGWGGISSGSPPGGIGGYSMNYAGGAGGTCSGSGSGGGGGGSGYGQGAAGGNSATAGGNAGTSAAVNTGAGGGGGGGAGGASAGAGGTGGTGVMFIWWYGSP